MADSRRSFFKLLGLGAASAAVPLASPSSPSSPSVDPPRLPYPDPKTWQERYANVLFKQGLHNDAVETLLQEQGRIEKLSTSGEVMGRSVPE